MDWPNIREQKRSFGALRTDHAVSIEANAANNADAGSSGCDNEAEPFCVGNFRLSRTVRKFLQPARGCAHSTIPRYVRLPQAYRVRGLFNAGVRAVDVRTPFRTERDRLLRSCHEQAHRADVLQGEASSTVRPRS